MFFSNEEEGASIAQASDNDFLLNYLVISPPPVTQPNIPNLTSGGSVINRKSELANSCSDLLALTEVGMLKFGLTHSVHAVVRSSVN